MKIGKYEVKPVVTGNISLDGGAMFGVVPKALWERSNPADDKNRINLSTRLLLLQSDSKNILVDTGIGEGWDEKFSRIYNVRNRSVREELSKYNITADDITDVIITHLHFDHTGGSVVKDNDKILPAYPNARYHVRDEQYNWALNASEKDKASFIHDRFVPLHAEGILNLLKDEEQLDDEISFIVINGHTFSQQLVKVSDGSETLLYCADLFPTASHIPLPYVMSYDLQPMVTLEEKKNILPQAVEENWKLFFEHDPEITAATVTRSLHGFGIGEVIEEL
jgi:glyoxylase-like metal-dependent hydrolase (beta-lactamase superfamily II)